MGKWGTGKVLKVCKECDKEFYARHDRKGLYCSPSCSSKNKPQKSFKISKKCEVCKVKFKIKRYRKNSALYCSNKCRRQRMPKKENHPNWKNGISKRPWKTRRVINEMIKYLKKCQNCGAEDYLQGHHIIPYSKRPDLGTVKENIEILCLGCHAKKHPELKKFILKGFKYEKEKAVDFKSY